jgi:hypothetical protein
MASLSLAKLGFDRIAARINEEGIPARTGKPWHGVVVIRPARILAGFEVCAIFEGDANK